MTIQAIADRYVDVTEFANGIGIHLQTVQRLIRQGTLPAVKPAIFGGRKNLIERSVYEQWKANYDARPGRKSYPGELPS